MNEVSEIKRYLKNDANLYSDLDKIKSACLKIWQQPAIWWFTEHGVDHSQRIIKLILSLLADTRELNKHEFFVLMASAYLHDIGMQKLDSVIQEPEKAIEADYIKIRKEHAQKSHDIIYEKLSTQPTYNEIQLPDINRDYLYPVALLCKGHSTDFFSEVVNTHYTNKVLGDRINIKRLVSLLLIADELDLHTARAPWDLIRERELSPISLDHWFRNHLTDVEIEKRRINVTLNYNPKTDEKHVEYFSDQIYNKLNQQLKNVACYLDLPLILKPIVPNPDVSRMTLHEKLQDYINNKTRKITNVNDNLPKVIVFDFDGTLTQIRNGKSTWEEIWDELGYQNEDCRKYWLAYHDGHITHQQWCDITMTHFKKRGLTKAKVIDIAKSYNQKLCLER